MNISRLFIDRPVATSLLCLGLVIAGSLAWRLLPIASLPEVNVPTIKVSAELPGASPATMVSAVATPLERALGRIAGVTEMTSVSTAGATDIRLTFDFSRNVVGAARDVQGAINAARGDLPSDMPATSWPQATSTPRTQNRTIQRDDGTDLSIEERHHAGTRLSRLSSSR